MTYCKSYQYIREVLALKDADVITSSWLSKAVDLTKAFLGDPKNQLMLYYQKDPKTLPEGQQKNFGHVRKNMEIRIDSPKVDGLFHGFFSTAFSLSNNEGPV